jgi:hypothetical protein
MMSFSFAIIIRHALDWRPMDYSKRGFDPGRQPRIFAVEQWEVIVQSVPPQA